MGLRETILKVQSNKELNKNDYDNLAIISNILQFREDEVTITNLLAKSKLKENIKINCAARLTAAYSCILDELSKGVEPSKISSTITVGEIIHLIETNSVLTKEEEMILKYIQITLQIF